MEDLPAGHPLLEATPPWRIEVSVHSHSQLRTCQTLKWRCFALVTRSSRNRGLPLERVMLIETASARRISQHHVPVVIGVMGEMRHLWEWIKGERRSSGLDRAYEYPDGVAFALRRPSVDVRSLSFGPLAGDSSGIRLAPNLIGLGLLEAIPEAAIRANADTEDVDDNGISGVAPEVFSEGVSVLGRFGLKSNVATVADQAAIAYHFDLGITSPRFPAENCPEEQITCTDAASGGFPEISAERLAAVVFYAQTLGVPTRVGVDDESVIAGEQLFDDIDCTACHTRRWETGIHEVESLSHQVIYPYTDMLLHDMGEDLSDGRTDGTATASEWRTSPLWGLGLVRTVNPDAGFLHDGRARSIEEAVLWHGGEGSTSRDLFVELSAQDRTFLLLFLKSL